jgi:hypothetical protein
MTAGVRFALVSDGKAKPLPEPVRVAMKADLDRVTSGRPVP